jgi:hypothetical protein
MDVLAGGRRQAAGGRQQVGYERRPLILLPLAKQPMGGAVSGVADRKFPDEGANFKAVIGDRSHPFRAFPKDQRCRHIHIISKIRKHGCAVVKGSKTPFGTLAFISFVARMVLAA